MLSSARFRLFRIRVESILVILLGIGVFVFGWHGFAQQDKELAATSRAAGVRTEEPTVGMAPVPAEAEPKQAPADSRHQRLYRVVQLYTLETGGEGPDNAWLIAARWCALLLFGWAVFRVIRLLFLDLFDNLWLIAARLLPRVSHHVVCGLGQIGLQIAADLAAKRRFGLPFVVAIEADEHNPNVRLARELGAIVVVGNASDPDTLRKAEAARAESVFVVSGSDDRNIDIAVQLEQSVFCDRKRSGSLRCYTHITEFPMAEAFRQHHVFRERGGSDRLELTIFNAIGNSARELVARHLSERLPQPDQVPHYVVFGFEQAAQAIVLHLAQLAHFSGLLRPRMTIVDDGVEPKQRRFRARYPRFCAAGVTLNPDDEQIDRWDSKRYRPESAYQSEAPQAIEYVCNAEFLEFDGELDLHSFEVNVVQKLAPARIHPAIIVCFDEDRRNFDMAIRVRRYLERLGHREIDIFVYLPKQEGLAQLLRSDRLAGMTAADLRKPHLARSVQPFGECHDTCNLQAVTRSSREQLARAFHQDYQDHFQKGQTQGGPSWEELDEALRNSNRLQAEHVAVKLSTIGCKAVRADAVTKEKRLTEIPEPQLELLAKMEHYRWVAERLMDGWSFGPKRDDPEQDLIHRQRETLCPWEQVPAPEREKDCVHVRRIPRVLADERREDQREVIVPVDPRAG